MKDRIKKFEDKTGEKKDKNIEADVEKMEEDAKVVLDYSKPTPFAQDGKRQGEWLKSYKFSEWYFDMDGNQVFIFPGYDGDTVGDLYD